MPPSEEKQYEVTLGEQFISNLMNSSTIPKKDQKNNGFAIRYTVPPESLRADKTALNMRKTPRGEYIIENPNPSEKSDSQINANASFKGTGSQAKDTDCVLVFNPHTKKYELGLLGMDIQVSPLLKSRLRSQTPSNGPQSENTTGSSVNVVHDRPASSKQQSNSNSPVKNTPHLNTPAHPASHVNPQSAVKTASGTLAPRSKTKARLPTRKKLTSSKPFHAALKNESDIDGDFQDSSRAPTPSLLRSSRFSSAEPQSEPANPLNPLNGNRNRDPKNNTVKPPVDSGVSDLHSSGTEADGFDDSFNNLADELADELGDDDDDDEDDDKDVSVNKTDDKVHNKAAWSAGTAGNVLDEDDVSSEEE